MTIWTAKSIGSDAYLINCGNNVLPNQTLLLHLINVVLSCLIEPKTVTMLALML